MPKTPRSSPNSIRTIEVLTFPAVQLLDVTGPVQVFASANDLVANVGGTPPYQLKLVTQGDQGVTSSARVRLAAVPLSQRSEALDTLLVAGGRGVEAAAANPALVDWLQQRATQARRVASVCTGAFLLAAAGPLDGRRAVTHWKDCARLSLNAFPPCASSPIQSSCTTAGFGPPAGVTAGIDLGLALVEEDLGRSMALAVARYRVVFLKRPGGQAQFSAALALQAADDKFGALHDWIDRHISDDLSLSVLADRAGMSERSFSRHYVEATGQTPARAIERLRVEAARRLLSESRTSIKRIAQRCGFGSEKTMRRGFLRLLAVTPQDYRSRFTF
jgi:transcriptional regulator GlxA family with amidase domain